MKRGEVYWVNLDPTVGTEIVAPLTSKGQPLGCRPELVFEGKPARILLDQLRSVDKARLLGRLGTIDDSLWHKTLLEMLA